MPLPQRLEGFFPTCRWLRTKHSHKMNNNQKFFKQGQLLYAKNSCVIQPRSLAEYVFGAKRDGDPGSHKHLMWSSLSTPKRKRSSRVKWANCTPSIRAWLIDALGGSMQPEETRPHMAVAGTPAATLPHLLLSSGRWLPSSELNFSAGMLARKRTRTSNFKAFGFGHMWFTWFPVKR